MKIVFLAAAKRDLRWFKRYYMDVFPEGRNLADAHYLKTRLLLMANPHLGHPIEYSEGAREYPVSRTPFSFIYRVGDDTIEIIRVLDGRSGDSNEIA